MTAPASRLAAVWLTAPPTRTPDNQPSFPHNALSNAHPAMAASSDVDFGRLSALVLDVKKQTGYRVEVACRLAASMHSLLPVASLTTAAHALATAASDERFAGFAQTVLGELSDACRRPSAAFTEGDASLALSAAVNGFRAGLDGGLGVIQRGTKDAVVSVMLACASGVLELSRHCAPELRRRIVLAFLGTCLQPKERFHLEAVTSVVPAAGSADAAACNEFFLQPGVAAALWRASVESSVAQPLVLCVRACGGGPFAAALAAAARAHEFRDSALGCLRGLEAAGLREACVVAGAACLAAAAACGSAGGACSAIAAVRNAVRNHGGLAALGQAHVLAWCVDAAQAALTLLRTPGQVTCDAAKGMWHATVMGVVGLVQVGLRAAGAGGAGPLLRLLALVPKACVPLLLDFAHRAEPQTQPLRQELVRVGWLVVVARVVVAGLLLPSQIGPVEAWVAAAAAAAAAAGPQAGLAEMAVACAHSRFRDPAAAGAEAALCWALAAVAGSTIQGPAAAAAACMAAAAGNPAGVSAWTLAAANGAKVDIHVWGVVLDLNAKFAMDIVASVTDGADDGMVDLDDLLADVEPAIDSGALEAIELPQGWDV